MFGKNKLTRPQWSWVLYDWANSAYATTVMAAFFPIFFKGFWCGKDMPATESTALLGSTNSIASLIILILAPLLGPIADRGGSRKLLLMIFSLMGSMATLSFFLVPQGHWFWASASFVFATVGFGMSNAFYDSLLVDLSDKSFFHKLSLYGFGAGYLGGGILMLVNALMTISPSSFGLADASAAVRWSFLTVGLWWFVFSLPLYFYVHEKKTLDRAPGWLAIKAGFIQLKATFVEIRGLKPVLIFLAGYIFYIDGVNTVMKMAVDYGMSIGLAQTDLIIAILIVQFVGFPAAFLGIWLAEKIGAKKGIYIYVGVYFIVSIWAYFIKTSMEFYWLAILIALAQGPVQSLSRSMFAHLIPSDKSGEFFGFYNMMGKMASLFGPLLIAATATLSGDSRMSMLPLVLLFGLGLYFLRLVPDDRKSS